MSEVLCVGGYLHGKEVELKFEHYIPVSKLDHRHFGDLSAEEQVNSEEPEDKYYLYRIGNLKDFYIWNDDPKLKENLADNYMKNKI
ncbi:MAG: hypothetical protein ACKOUU_09335 [Acinetobacter tjernbergiae]